jgi:hypothetical protein
VRKSLPKAALFSRDADAGSIRFEEDMSFEDVFGFMA